MSNLDAGTIRRSIDRATGERLSELEVFSEIESTNSYLMQQPGPEPGCCRVALTDNQTAGRGRHGKSWQSPAGSGLCLSMAYTFDRSPESLPALTLAIGLGVIETLARLAVTGVQLKWPNDLIALDGKLGGILTETQNQPGGAMSIVTGVGINLDLEGQPDFEARTDWGRPIVDLRSAAGKVPKTNELAAQMITGLHGTFVEFEGQGFAAFAPRWAAHDWLFGRVLSIDAPRERVTGVGAGIADDGALLVDTGAAEMRQVVSGSIVMAGTREGGA